MKNFKRVIDPSMNKVDCYKKYNPDFTDEELLNIIKEEENSEDYKSQEIFIECILKSVEKGIKNIQLIEFK